MNEKTIITDFLCQFDFTIVPSSKRPNSPNHTALTLVTRMPNNIPIEKEIFFNATENGVYQYSVQIDIEAAIAPNWFFVTLKVF